MQSSQKEDNLQSYFRNLQIKFQNIPGYLTDLNFHMNKQKGGNSGKKTSMHQRKTLALICINNKELPEREEFIIAWHVKKYFYNQHGIPVKWIYGSPLNGTLYIYLVEQNQQKEFEELSIWTPGPALIDGYTWRYELTPEEIPTKKPPTYDIQLDQEMQKHYQTNGNEPCYMEMQIPQEWCRSLALQHTFRSEALYNPMAIILLMRDHTPKIPQIHPEDPQDPNLKKLLVELQSQLQMNTQTLDQTIIRTTKTEIILILPTKEAAKEALNMAYKGLRYKGIAWSIRRAYALDPQLSTETRNTFTQGMEMEY